MLTHSARPAPRLVLLLDRRDDGDLLLKAGPGSGAKIAHQSGYALYGNPPRWRKITAEHPAPKGAPVASHPGAAGKHAAVAHFSDAQWDALKLPDSNVNAPSFNAALAKLRSWSDAGNVTAIVGAGYGTNTYGKKLATIANHLLALHGSEHKVAAGQKAGEHAGVKAAPEAKGPAPTTEPLSPMDKQTVDSMVAKDDADALQSLIDKSKKPATVAYAKQKLAELEAAAPEAAAPAPADPMAPTLGAGLSAMIDKMVDAPDAAEKLQNVVDLHSGTSGSPAIKAYAQKKLAEVKAKQAESQDPQAAPAAGPLQMPDFEEGKTTSGVKAYYQKVAQHILTLAQAGDVGMLEQLKAAGLQPNSKGKPSNTWAGKTANSKKLLALHEAALAHAKGGKSADDKPLAGIPAYDFIAMNTGPNSSPKELAEDWLKDNPGKESELSEALQSLGYPELAANMDLPAPDADDEPAKPPRAADPAPPPAAPASASKLAQIPWDAHLLPDSNSNAPSHNKAVQKIKAMAEAGDVAGLQSFVDSKAGAKQTYAKKQGLLAYVALAAIKESAPAAPTPPPAENKTAEQMGAKVTTLPDPFSSAPAAPPPPKTVTAPKYTWHNTTDGHSKQWSQYVVKTPSGADLVTEYGKIGGTQQKTVKSFPDYAAAGAAALKLTKEKQAKGYKHVATDYGHKVEVPSASADSGPKDGDTKPAADGGTLVFKDGHWHKQEQPKAAAPAPHPLDAVQVPDFSDDDSPWGIKYANAAKAILEHVKAGGKLSTYVTSHKTGQYAGGFTVTYAGSKLRIKPGDTKPRRVKMLTFIQQLQQAAGKAPKTIAKPPSATPAPATSSITGHPEPMDSWVQTGGQGGSNPGGRFRDPSGQEWYCKFPQDEATARSEVLAAKLYSLAGLGAQDAKLITKGGKVGIASKWVDVQKAGSPAKLAAVAEAQSGFAVDAWLANWDVVGLGYDNLQIGPDGKAIRIDAGGSLEYRAQGAKKPFGPKVDEIDTLRDAAKNPQAASIFGKMTEADIAASVAKVAGISDVAIRAMVNEFGPGTQSDKEKLAATLIARKQDLLKRYPQAAKPKKKHEFKPEKISAPPSFMNWGGSGKSGPSSKEFLNQANEDAVQAIYAAAKTGSIEAIQKLTAKVYNKDTGAVTGEALVLEHPSQHVKGYAQQAVNEINYQLNPPKRFRFDGGHPLHALNNAYPSHKGPLSSKTAQKLGKFLVLGQPGTIKLEDVGLPAKIKHAEGGGTLSKSTYASAAQAAAAKMPKTQLQALQSYTGSGYQQINGSLWSGNPSGAAAAAGEALHTLGHDIAPGTVLSRKITLNGGDLQQLIGAQGKILQEPAVMSTSIRPSSWSGNVHLKLHVGPGVKGLWVGAGSKPGGGAVSLHSGEDEMLLPPNTRLLVLSVKPGGKTDEDGFGAHAKHVIEVLVLPTQ